jgi:GTP-binding protein EngB required for normal cell division
MTDATLDDRLQALTEATRLLGRVVSARTAADVEALTRQAGQRVGLGLDLTVVALAGSTGSGKSTLFNAIAGLDLAEAGVRRPTTTEALACIWGSVGADPMLEWLQVPTRRRVARQSALDDSADPLDGLVLLDLPDHDSMVTEHRVEVDRLVGLVDVVVWVTDPVKYADALLHEEYLAALTKHGSVVLVVLNQIDLLNAAEQRECLTDLRRLVREDGLLDVEVMAASGRTGNGLEALRARLEGVVDSRQAATQRLAADVAVLATTVRAEAGLAGTRAHSATPLDHQELAVDDLDGLVRDVGHALGVERAVDAVHRSESTCAREHLRWPVIPADAEAVPEPADVSSEPARRLVHSYLDNALKPLPSAWAEQVQDELAESAEALPARWASSVASVEDVASPAPSWWGQHRQRQWAVLGTGALGALVALVLVGLLVAGSPVPAWAWAAPVVLVGAAGVGGVALNRRVEGAAQEWADARADAARSDLTARIRHDAGASLDAPVRGHLRDFERAQEALTIAGG